MSLRGHTFRRSDEHDDPHVVAGPHPSAGSAASSKPAVSSDHVHTHDHPHGGDHADGAHGHRHDLRSLGLRALTVALLLNGAFFFVEVAAGVWSGSLALLSDGAHMLSDVVGLGVAVLAARARLRPPAGRATFGYARVAVLGGLLNASLAMAAAVWIVVEALGRLRAPPQVLGLPILIVGFAGLMVNLVSAWWLARSGDHGVNMRGALLHMMGDALGSVAALVAGGGILLGVSPVIDPAASFVVAAVIVASGIPLARDALLILLERAPRGLDLGLVQQAVAAVSGVEAMSRLHAWELDDGEVMASVVLLTTEHDLVRLAAVSDDIKDMLAQRFSIQHATIEWRPTQSPRACC